MQSKKRYFIVLDYEKCEEFIIKTQDENFADKHSSIGSFTACQSFASFDEAKIAALRDCKINMWGYNPRRNM